MTKKKDQEEMVTITVSRKKAEEIEAIATEVKKLEKGFVELKRLLTNLQKQIKEVTKKQDYHY